MKYWPVEVIEHKSSKASHNVQNNEHRVTQAIDNHIFRGKKLSLTHGRRNLESDYLRIYAWYFHEQKKRKTWRKKHFLGHRNHAVDHSAQVTDVNPLS